MGQDAVRALALGADGAVWIGTQSGLLRARGNKVETIPIVSDVGPADRYVQTLAAGPGGEIWMGSRLQLGIWEPGADMARTLNLTWEPGAGSVIDELAVGPDGTVWIASAGRLWRHTRGDPIVYDVPLSVPDSVTSLSVGDGGLWAGTASGRLLGVRGPGAPQMQRDFKEPIIAVWPGRGAGLWVATASGGVEFVDPSAEPVGSIRLDLSVRVGGPVRVEAGYHDSKGMVWIGTQTGAYIWDPRTDGVCHVPDDGNRDGGLRHGTVTSIFQDQQDNTWIGTWLGAHVVSRYWPAIRAVRLRDDPAAEKFGVYAIEPAGDGGFWLGAQPGTVLHANATLGDSWPAVRDARTPNFVSLAADGGMNLWAAAPGRGAWKLPQSMLRQRGSTSPTDGNLHLPGAFVLEVAAGPTGTIVAGTTRDGAHILEDGGFIPLLDKDGEPATAGMYTRPIRVDEKGNVAIGIWGDTLGGVFWWNRERGVYRRVQGIRGDTASALPSTRILTFLDEPDGSLWMGTEGDGLLYLAPGQARARQWTTGNSDLPHNNVQGVLRDDSGLVWVATSSGIARLDPTDESFRLFGEGSGINGPRYFADAVHKDPDGNLIFGGPDGLTVIDPSGVHPLPDGSPVALTGFRVHGRERPVAEALDENGLDLGPNENFFTFDFAALDFIDPTLVRYRYRLSPLEDDWIEVGETGTANYTSVPPGPYTFEMSATNSEGVTTRGRDIPVYVRAPYYATLWFRSLALLALLCAIAALYAYRVQQLRHRQALRLKIAGGLHDDVGANLSALALKLAMLDQAPGLERADRDRLRSLVGLARDTAHKVREIVWVVNTKYDTVAGLLAKMRDAVDTMVGDSALGVSLDMPDPQIDRPIDMQLRQEIYLMFKEALHNVAKHSGGEQVSIQVEWTDPVLTWRVSDDGTGFDPESRADGSGLDLMRERAKRHGGTLVVDSGEDGTTVEYRVSFV